jgi:hypothetical protein
VRFRKDGGLKKRGATNAQPPTKKWCSADAPGYAPLPLGIMDGVYRRQRHHFSAVGGNKAVTKFAEKKKFLTTRKIMSKIHAFVF